MRVMCSKCGSKARIASRENISQTISHLYCQCLDAKHCAHTFVMSLSFSHTINPPIGAVNSIVLDVLRNLPGQQQLELLEQARQQAA